MGRKKRSIKGKIYITNDSLFSKDGYKKSGRRVVVINNKKQEAEVCKIKSIKDKNGRVREKLIPIERYPCLTKDSGVDPKVLKKIATGKKIDVTKMKTTTSRLNKWDMEKVKKRIKK